MHHTARVASSEVTFSPADILTAAPHARSNSDLSGAAGNERTACSSRINARARDDSIVSSSEGDGRLDAALRLVATKRQSSAAGESNKAFALANAISSFA